jgi:hypothetical protein
LFRGHFARETTPGGFLKGNRPGVDYSLKVEAIMNDPRNADVTAATRLTQPAVLAAISSGEGQPVAPEPARANSGLQPGLMLLAAGLALGTLATLWMQRAR